MNLSLLARFLGIAMATTFASSSQPGDQFAFRIQQGNPDYASSGTPSPSILVSGPFLCGVGLRTSGYPGHCYLGYVCKGGSKKKPESCEIVKNLSSGEGSYHQYQCDHIIDLHIVSKALASANFCEAMKDIRKIDPTNKLGDDDHYIKPIRIVANNWGSVAFLDKEVHEVKSELIKFYLGTRKVAVGSPGPIYKGFLKKYHTEMFDGQSDDEYNGCLGYDCWGTKVAKALDLSAYEALTQMVEDIKDKGQKKDAQAYLDGTTWKTARFVSASREAASQKWTQVEGGWP